MNYTAIGRIKVIFDEQHITEKFNTREFVLVLDEHTEYPQHCKFVLINNNCDKIIGFRPGDVVEVTFEVRGRYGKNQTGPYNQLVVFKIQKDDSV